jgi:ribosomal protein S12 methylthiotransferase accessory factor
MLDAARARPPAGGADPAEKGWFAGTHRTRAPQATLDAFSPCMPRLGITRLADVTGLDVVGVPVYMAVRPNARGLSVSQGKGLDRASAKASALMEAIETWHGEFIELPLRYDSYDALRRAHHAIDVTRLARHRNATRRTSVPLPWIDGWDLIAERPTWVPFACVTTNFVEPQFAGSGYIASTNGLASGNHLAEATVHALCELIERDATALWEAAGGASYHARRVELASIPAGGALGELLDRIHAAGLELAVWDVASELAVPAFACRLLERPDAPRWTLRGSFGGFGCHLSAEVALARAITEALQSRLTAIAGSRDDIFDDASRGNPDDTRALAAAVDLSGATFEHDAALLVERLRAAGVRSAVAVDLTRPELGVPVVKVVATDLETHWGPSYEPGPRALAARRRAVAA